ncbi:MAG: PEP-CTERM sorting domain-containing protein [Phycisphaerae bacterium]
MRNVLNPSRPGGVAAGFLAVLAAVTICSQSAKALVFHSTGDPGYNTSAPTGTYADSGWRFQAEWSYGGATAISPQHLLTASHFGGNIVGKNVVFHGSLHQITHYVDDSSSDLRILEVSEPLGAWAPLYSGSSEFGKEIVLHGRGRPRGNEVTEGGELKGWQWDARDGVQRWGKNEVTDISTAVNPSLVMQFDSDGGTNEAGYSEWDSGSGAFIFNENTGQYELAGVGYGVDGPYNFQSGDTGAFSGSVFDEGGLWENQGSWTYHHDTGRDKPQEFHATRVSAQYSWIYDEISSSLPTAGDANLDGIVDFSDAWAVLASYKTDGDYFWFDGDFTHDGIVDEADVDLLLANYGAGVAGGLDSSTISAMFDQTDGTAVPEPGTLILLGIGSIMFARRK